MKKYWRLLIAVFVVLAVGVVIYGTLYTAPSDDKNTNGALNSPEQWSGYVESFPEYRYNRVEDASFEDRHFALKDTPKNEPEGLVALHYYYIIAGEYDKLYDLCGSESLQLSAVNTKKNNDDGIYMQEYIVRQLSTLSIDEFVNRDYAILEMIKTNVEQNQLTEYTFVEVDFTMTSPPGQEAFAELSDGDHTFYFLCGKNQADEWKLFELYWE